MPKFLSGISCGGINLGFQITSWKELQGLKSGERAGLLQPIYVTSSAPNGSLLSSCNINRVLSEHLFFFRAGVAIFLMVITS
jgi:hypothetical protein